MLAVIDAQGGLSGSLREFKTLGPSRPIAARDKRPIHMDGFLLLYFDIHLRTEVGMHC